MPSASIGLSVVPGLLPTLLAPLLATLLLAPPIAAQDGTADIWSAARQGDLAGVRRILQATPDQLQARDDSQRTALHLAARWGRLEVLRLLLDRGAEVDAKAYNRFTPLHLAVTFRRPACVAELLARGADVEAVTAFDRTALQLAAQRADRQLVAALREAGARYDALTAVQLDDAERIDELLRGPDFETSHDVIEAAVARGDAVIVAKLLPRWRNRPRFLPNFTAVPLLFQATAHADVVRLLIGNGQDPAHRMTDTGMTWIDAGSTLLHAAAKRGHHATLRYLLGLEAFAAPDACRDAQQRTPAHTAAHNGHLQALVALHTAGSDLLARDRRGRTCVHHAAYAGNAEILAYLVQQGVALDGVDDGGGNALAHATRDLHPTAETTPARIAAAWVLVRHGVPADLHAAIAIGDHARAAALLEQDGARARAPGLLRHAISFGRRRIVAALLDAGADPMATDAHGNTALHQSALWRQPDITALLIARGVELDATQRHGRTAVHDAVRADCAAALEHLLAAGAKADIADAEGKLPIDHAGPHSSPRIRELLAKK